MSLTHTSGSTISGPQDKWKGPEVCRYAGASKEHLEASVDGME